MTTNPHRGEVSLKLGARELTLRPTFAALVAIERETGMGLLAVFTRLHEGSIEHVPIVIREAARAAGEEVERTAIEAHISEAGVAPALNAAIELMARAITGGAEKKSEPSPATAAG